MAAFAGPEIITEGLAVHLDAANPRSYPGSGTTWQDLSGRGMNGTLVNGVQHEQSFRGCFSVDGVDDYVLVGGIPLTGSATTSISWGIWAYPTGTSGNIMSMSSINPQGSWNMPPIAATGQRFRGKIWSNGYIFSNTYVTNRWYYLVLSWRYSTISSERGQFFYVNGDLVGSQTDITYGSSGASNFHFLGQANPGADNTGMFGGKIGAFHVYTNRFLSDNEVKQNFNAMRGRYGI